jgi:Cu/Ag efflux protein CusF
MNFSWALRGVLGFLAFVIVAGAPAPTIAQSDNEKDAFVGTVEKIDKNAKKVYVKSKDGVVKAYKWTSKTTVHGVKEAAVWTDHELHVGTHVVIRSAKIAGEDTIKGIHWFGKGTVKVFDASVKRFGKGSKKAVVTAADGSKEIYEISEHAVVKAGKSIGHGLKHAEKKTKKEVNSFVHVVEKNGKKFIHFMEHKTKS